MQVFAAILKMYEFFLQISTNLREELNHFCQASSLLILKFNIIFRISIFCNHIYIN